jgi:hypothetical protein
MSMLEIYNEKVRRAFEYPKEYRWSTPRVPV